METNEENKIQEADIIPAVAEKKLQKENVTEVLENPVELGEEMLEKKAKSELRSRWVLTFVLGLLIGIALKTEALKRVTIGYDDYLMKIKSQNYNINELQAKLQKQTQEATQLQEQQNNTETGTNSEAEGDSGNADDSGATSALDSEQNN